MIFPVLGAAGGVSSPLPLVWSSAAAPVSLRLSILSSRTQWFLGSAGPRLGGGQIESSISRTEIRAAPRLHPHRLSGTVSALSTISSHPAGAKTRANRRPRKNQSSDLKSMEHQTDGDIATLSVTALKALITSAGLSYAGCVEKSDLRERAADRGFANFGQLVLRLHKYRTS